MMYTPASLFMDTSYYVSQGLKFNTKDFERLKSEFPPRSLRLILPAVAVRELKRKFEEYAQNTTAEFLSSARKLPDQVISEIPDAGKDKLEFTKAVLGALEEEWDGFKELFVIDELPSVGNLEKVLDWYFERKPPFGCGKKAKEFPDALIFSSLDEYYSKKKARIAVVSRDNDMAEACKGRHHCEYFESLSDYLDSCAENQRQLEQGTVVRGEAIAAEQLREIQSIILMGCSPTTIEVQRLLQLIKDKGSNYEFFFQRIADPFWVGPLLESGYFKSPPGRELIGKDRVAFPFWWPVVYLSRIAEKVPGEVVEVVLEIEETENPRVLHEIAEIAFKIPDVFESLRLETRIGNYVDAPFPLARRKILPQLLLKWASGGEEGLKSALRLCRRLIAFRPDHLAEEKKARRRADPDDFYTVLNPETDFDQWEYQQILEKGIRPLAEAAPLETVRVVVDAVVNMIQLKFHEGEREEDPWDDLSEIWCVRVNEASRSYSNPKETLVSTLTYACEQVYAKMPETIPELDTVLHEGRWLVFDRIRMHLYAMNLTEETMPWIREFIVNHEGYYESDHRYEFQRMVRMACEHFGDSLLSEEERIVIFDSILSGFSKERYRGRMGEHFTEERFQVHKQYFHLKQLRPFETVLCDRFRRRYEELFSEEEKAPTDNDYSPYRSEGTKSGGNRSPVSVEELASMTDSDLVAFLNEWQDVHRDPDEWWIDVDFVGLGLALQEVVIDDMDRFANWADLWQGVQRPVYFVYVLAAAAQVLKSGLLDHLDAWFDLCDWILTHSDSALAEDEKRADTSRDSPCWRSARRAVLDFLETCLSKEVNVPTVWRERIFSLLKNLSTGYDRRLDQGEFELAKWGDPMGIAIDNTRGRALEGLIDYGRWVRMQTDESTEVREMFEVLETRLSGNPSVSLPEFALLGSQLNRMFFFDPEWVQDNARRILPRSEQASWKSVFGMYLSYNSPLLKAFEIMRPEFEYALSDIRILTSETDQRRDLISTLGEHLFRYFAWELIPLEGNDSLLAQYYAKTQTKHWAHLFDYVGRSLKRNETPLEAAIHDKIMQFFDSRIAVGCGEELKEFNFWLEAECLDARWRLESYSKILDVVKGIEIGITLQIEALRGLLDSYPDLVVTCFAKLTDRAQKVESGYIQSEEAIPILRSGLKSANPETEAAAERARENLLKAGRFEFLDIDLDQEPDSEA